MLLRTIIIALAQVLKVYMLLKYYVDIFNHFTHRTFSRARGHYSIVLSYPSTQSSFRNFTFFYVFYSLKYIAKVDCVTFEEVNTYLYSLYSKNWAQSTVDCYPFLLTKQEFVERLRSTFALHLWPNKCSIFFRK